MGCFCWVDTAARGGGSLSLKPTNFLLITGIIPTEPHELPSKETIDTKLALGEFAAGNLIRGRRHRSLYTQPQFLVDPGTFVHFDRPHPAAA